MKKNIPLFKVFMSKNIIKPLKEVLYSGYVTEGEKTKQFENALAKFIGNEKVLSLNSCTSALQLALRLAGVQYGDEVITSPLTCVATNSPVLASGAKIKWADINPATGNIDYKLIEKNITKKTRAILYVHWGGDPADIDEINKIAKKYKLKVIEDAAHAFGAEYKGKKIGNHSDFVCFSFQAIKHLTTVDGGCLFCKSKDDYLRGKKLRWFGIDREARKAELFWDYNIEEYGYKFHMNNITATIGIEQLKYIDLILEKHCQNANYYLKELQSIKKITHLKRQLYVKSVFWVFTMLVDDREEFVKLMKKHNIDTSVVHIRNDYYDVFKQFKANLPGVDKFTARYLSIPCGWWVTKKDAKYIVDVIKKGW